jgi:hypothetical protein
MLSLVKQELALAKSDEGIISCSGRVCSGRKPFAAAASRGNLDELVGHQADAYAENGRRRYKRRRLERRGGHPDE